MYYNKNDFCLVLVYKMPIISNFQPGPKLCIALSLKQIILKINVAITWRKIHGEKFPVAATWSEISAQYFQYFHNSLTGEKVKYNHWDKPFLELVFGN